MMWRFPFVLGAGYSSTRTPKQDNDTYMDDLPTVHRYVMPLGICKAGPGHGKHVA